MSVCVPCDRMYVGRGRREERAGKVKLIAITPCLHLAGFELLARQRVNSTPPALARALKDTGGDTTRVYDTVRMSTGPRGGGGRGLSIVLDEVGMSGYARTRHGFRRCAISLRKSLSDSSVAGPSRCGISTYHGAMVTHRRAATERDVGGLVREGGDPARDI